MDEKFAADVHAQYNGLTNGGKFDAEIKSTSQFKEFETLVQKSCDCFGGDPALALEIACAPENGDVYKYFTDWNKTAVNQPNVMSMETMAIWELMSLAADPKVYKRVDDFSNAYKWISSNPGVYITKCRFTINSDWGEIGLLTPSAFIEKDPASPPPTDNVNFQTTKVSFGREHSYQFKRDVIVEYVAHSTNLGRYQPANHHDTASSSETMVLQWTFASRMAVTEPLRAVAPAVW